MNKKLRAMLALVMSTIMLSGTIAGCNGGGNTSSSVGGGNSSVSDSSVGGGDSSVSDSSAAPKTYTYKTYTSVSPSNWNELTYQDNNDTQIMSYISSPLFEYNFNFDDNGEIVPDDFVVEMSFATSLTDVSEAYGYDAGAGMAWQITIRDDGRWDDGTPIVAGDFVYTMKEQLNPLFMNYRADSFYAGATIIKNAQNYVYQGQTLDVADNNDFALFKTTADLTKDGDNYYLGDSELAFAITTGCSWNSGEALADYAGTEYFDDATAAAALAELIAMADAEGYVPVTDATIALMGAAISDPDWNESPDNWYSYVHVFDYVYRVMDFSEVGFKAPNDTTIEIELEQPLHLTNPDGTPGYKAAYNMASLPLVKEDLYEDCKVDPVTGSTLYTSIYNSSLETTASWGPYKLTYFEDGKMYKMEKNPYWYGWNMDKYDGQYQTTHIECETIEEWNTAWLKFQKGEMMGIGINVTIADEYKSSARAYFTPDDYVGALQLQSDKAALKTRETEGVNKSILSYADFRKALSLGLDRTDYVKKTTTSSQMGLGLFGPVHYYNVEKGAAGAYRNTDAAKRVLCNIYGIELTGDETSAELDILVKSITGYDLTQAKELVESAYAAAYAAGDINDTDVVKLTWGTSVDNENTRRAFDNLNTQFQNLMEGTVLEGRFELEFEAKYGNDWANAFRRGEYDICQGGWSGAAWDPGYMLMAYLSAAYMYSQAWDTNSHLLQISVPGVAANGAPTNNPDDVFTSTMPVYNWWYYLNTLWASGALDEDFRLVIIAALEQEVLLQYYTVPYSYSSSASLISYQVDYITYEYNTFMGYGGIQYMTYNYDDAAWAEFVAANADSDGLLNYK